MYLVELQMYVVVGHEEESNLWYKFTATIGEWQRHNGSMETQHEEVSKEEIFDDVMEKEYEAEYVYDKAEKIQIEKSDLVPKEETIEKLVMGYERDQVFVCSLCMEIWLFCVDKKEEFNWKVYFMELQMYAVVKLLLEMND